MPALPTRSLGELLAAQPGASSARAVEVPADSWVTGRLAVGHLPEGADHAAGAGPLEGLAQPGDALPAADVAQAWLAGAEHHQLAAAQVQRDEWVQELRRPQQHAQPDVRDLALRDVEALQLPRQRPGHQGTKLIGHELDVGQVEMGEARHHGRPGQCGDAWFAHSRVAKDQGAKVAHPRTPRQRHQPLGREGTEAARRVGEDARRDVSSLS